MSRPTRLTSKTRNWPTFNEVLKHRGSLTIWFDLEMIWEAPATVRRGRQQTYSDAAIQAYLSMKVLVGMALRQTTWFVESMLCLVGLDLATPDFSTLSRRTEDPGHRHPVSGLQGPAASASGQHLYQGRGRRRVERPKVRRCDCRP